MISVFAVFLMFSFPTSFVEKPVSEVSKREVKVKYKKIPTEWVKVAKKPI